MNTDYTLEGGASRNFEAAKTAELLARAAQKEFEEEELNNPMKVRAINCLLFHNMWPIFVYKMSVCLTFLCTNKSVVCT